ncbi:MAG TPA: 50S ribosomal protein L11 methyltransferase [Trueperaceae bacterium]|nr:50S ribosomal protein L11 methyltransferase [Trueperaceae bacterium]
MKVFRVGGLTGESPEVARLWELGCRGVQEVTTDSGDTELIAYFEEQVETGILGTWDDLPDHDYLAEYRAGLEPVRAGRLVVAPGHARVSLGDGDAVVWLDPGSAFGTGHHETTAMALEALAGRDLNGKSVLDVGSGSGLLAIAADVLGAEAAYGIDVDQATVTVARQNARRNRSRARFAVGTLPSRESSEMVVNPVASDGLGDAGTFAPARGLPGRFDLLVANLYAELHVALAPVYAARLLPDGEAVLTGILGRLAPSVEDALSAAGLRVTNRLERGEWALIEAQVRA